MARARLKTPEQRAAENARYAAGIIDAGIIKVLLHVPAVRIPELRAITLAWRKEAKLLLESDQPTADQILQIHGVCRTLGLDLPVKAFETRASAAYWLLAQESKLARRRVYIPKTRIQPGA